MFRGQYTEEFEEAVRQVAERGCSVSDVAKRLRVSAQSLYELVKAHSSNAADQFELELKEARRGNLSLMEGLQRAKEERDILKKPL